MYVAVAVLFVEVGVPLTVTKTSHPIRISSSRKFSLSKKGRQRVGIEISSVPVDVEVVSGVIVTGTTVSVPVVHFLVMRRELGSDRYILVMVMMTCYKKNSQVSPVTVSSRDEK